MFSKELEPKVEERAGLSERISEIRKDILGSMAGSVPQEVISVAAEIIDEAAETEGMKDGSDAIADWPILNALLNAVSGASWVSVHHGGGVGIGKSIHAGMVIVADGTKEMQKRLNRVLTNDPGTGIVRHTDAGYPEALKVALQKGIKIPMLKKEEKTTKLSSKKSVTVA